MNSFLNILAVSVVVLLLACSGKNDSSGEAAVQLPAKFRSQLSDLVNVYLDLKDALVKGNDSLAHQSGLTFREAISAIDASGLPAEMKAKWDKNLADLQAEIEELIGKEDIMGQRSAFQPLSQSVIDCAKEYRPSHETLYVQHCPMALDHNGGDWISKSVEVYNPYYGSMMLHCGSVTDTLTVASDNR